MKKDIKPLPIKIDAGSAVPVYEQVKQAIKIYIVSRYLQADDQLPPIREFAAGLQINPNTIVKVYYQLDVEGFIFSKVGQGYFVRPHAPVDKKTIASLFKALTDEYIAKSLKMGYSLDEIAMETSKRRQISHGEEIKS
jgi:GntR family transcriptional regulator